MNKFPEDGIYYDVDIDTYHEDRSIISGTGLKQVKKSSRHFAWYLAFGSEAKPAFDMGNAFELALLSKVNGVDIFSEKVAIFDPSLRPSPTQTFAANVNKDWKELWEKTNEGKYVITTDTKAEIDTMVKACMAEPTIVKLLEITQYQASFVWTDPNTGVKCKTRPDLAIGNKKVIVDIKSTKAADPSGFQKECVKFDYFLSAIMQMEGAIQTGFMDEVDSYFFLAVEKSEPYNACLYEFAKEDWQIVKLEYEYYMRRAAQAIQSFKDSEGDVYKVHGYSENADNKFGIVNLSLPAWYGR